jgi:hydroxylaminobenzene mutase
MSSSSVLSRQGHRLLQIGVALLVFSSFEGFAIPHFAAPRLGLSVHTLSALQGVLLLALGLVWLRLKLGATMSRVAIKGVAYSSAPTGLIAFGLILWGLRISAAGAEVA